MRASNDSRSFPERGVSAVLVGASGTGIGEIVVEVYDEARMAPLAHCVGGTHNPGKLSYVEESCRAGGCSVPAAQMNQSLPPDLIVASDEAPSLKRRHAVRHHRRWSG
jgi:hypothetical protein